MLKIKVPGKELWDDVNECFIKTDDVELCLEHSLVSLSKWESKWHKPFLDNRKLTNDEMIDYIKCMTLTKNVDPNVYLMLDQNNINEIGEYINDKHTATWFSEEKGKKGKASREVITSEIIYYWMISLQIPFECQRWHLERLLTLIRVCNEKNAPKKKMSKREIMERNKALNDARRKASSTTG